MSPAAHELLDVLIVGGGPAGACAGALLACAPRSLKVGILEHARPIAPAPGSPLDARVSALSRASEHILASAGAWERIACERLQPYERMRVWNAGAGPRANVLVFDAAEAGEPNLGYIAENRLVQAALIEAFEASGGRLFEDKLAAVRVHDEHVEAQTATGTLAARLIVGADGARSAVRQAIGLTAEVASYRQTAIVANVATEQSHARTAWQRFLGSGTLALLPLADGASSIVWSADTELAQRLLEASPEEFERELESASQGVLGALRLKTERFSLALTRLAAHRYTAHRAALIGDAAHVVHPLAGQGANLGLLDAAVLAEVITQASAQGEDPGAAWALRRYERWRKSEVQLMALAIDAFDRFLAHGSGPLAELAQRGLAWVDRSAEMKRVFIARALGLKGELPQSARAR
ncbi:MAG TPA: FAD-dependent monooxygenase [Steroidobacteraceae bacterium]|nr:FAD-dependent monooxygenase [Steroidobacteraceae bacterium]